MTRSTVAAVLEESQPDRVLVAVEPVTRGSRRQTAIARFETGPPLVVQCGADERATWTEALLTRAIRDRTSVPVPVPLDTGTVAGVAYLVSEHCPGTDLHERFTNLSPERRRHVAAQFGDVLAQLHAAFAFDGCGELVPRDDVAPSTALDDLPDPESVLGAPAGDCRRWLVEYGRAAIERLPPAFDALRDRLVDRLRSPSTPEGPPRLFPWDLRPGNALLADGEVTAVVDWERPLAAPPALALAKVEYLVADWYVDDPAPLRAAVRRGYERHRPLPDVGPAARITAIADTAVDSRGRVTTPRYPEVDRETAVAFHRDALARVVSG